MKHHVKPLLSAYVSRDLSPRKRAQVWAHLQTCQACRAALAETERIHRDLRQYLPQIGQPRPSQLARRWPALWNEVRRTPPRAPAHPGGKFLPSYGMLLLLIALIGFGTSLFFSGSVSAIAAPLQAIPAEVEATWTPASTDLPGVTAQPTASQTAAFMRHQPPMASPIPRAGVVNPSGSN